MKLPFILYVFLMTYAPTSAVPENVYTIEGSSYTFVCPHRKTSSSNVVWQFTNKYGTVFPVSDGTFIPTNYPARDRVNIVGNHNIGQYNLKLSGLQETDEGTYRCGVSINQKDYYLLLLGSGSNIPEDLIKKSIQSINDLRQNLPNLVPEQDLISRYDQTNPNPHGKGRNQLNIDVTKLQQLMAMGFTVKKIAEDGLLGGVIHPNTLYKRLKEHDLQVRSSYSTITDDQLEEKVAEYNREHPNAGAMEVHSYLKTQGIFIQRARCRAVLTKVDSAGAAKRWSCTIQRREYKVPTANSIWHLDTHHSLGRWGIVVHGGIDGHSRLMPFLRASTYNTAKAAACFFVNGVKQFGVPSRIRADHGTEYVDIGPFMIAVNGEARGSFITGPSVHNQRIERQWRDVFCKVLDTYYKLFCLMEEHKLLSITNKVHRWILHYVFVPRIDLALREWTETHNNHKVRTEHNKTPNMMWVQSLLLSNPEKHTGVRNIEHPPEERIQQTMQNLSIGLDDEQFLQPRDSCPLTDEYFVNLQQDINLKRHSTSHGMDIFGEVLQFVTSHTA